MDDKQVMMLQLQQIQFMLVELNLFLDTHVDDQAAIAQYNMLHQLYHELMMSYNEKFGPLMGFGHAAVDKDCFTWVNSPWPWQMEANTPPTAGGM